MRVGTPCRSPLTCGNGDHNGSANSYSNGIANGDGNANGNGDENAIHPVSCGTLMPVTLGLPMVMLMPMLTMVTLVLMGRHTGNDLDLWQW